jgi:UV DNA damage endonuclease
MPKRKRSSAAPTTATADTASTPLTQPLPPKGARRASTRTQPAPATVDPNPNTNTAIEDAPGALRASPDSVRADEAQPKKRKTKAATTPKQHVKEEADESPFSELEDVESPSTAATPVARSTKANKKLTPPTSVSLTDDPEGEGEEDADPHEIQEALSRPPPVNSSYLPLPWKGRLGYACLNTYLRAAHIPVFSSRTCRIASILEHRHPLKDPTQPEHATKNRPDKDQPADIARGQAYVEALGLANARDIPKMLRWNDRYGIKFLRLSSEMFPFASHDVYGYKLAPFASEALAEAGRVAADLGHRLTTHPGQFTQLGSPRKEVITASIRDLEYHCELLDLLKLPPQQDRDAVMILHMGGIFGDKAATLDRFRENYAQLSPSIKKRLVLENDDVCYSVHDLLPICEELNIPLVLDYHHHNLVFDADKIREGTLDIMKLYDRITATWTRKNITQKMHYSEPTPAAITARQRRKHNPRVATLPPCAPDMDLMIEAKDKEQAVFELMRTFKLPGYDTFNDVLPYVRNDENRPWKPPKKKTPKKKKSDEDVDEEPEPQPPPIVPKEEVSMGGTEGRVYWPPGMEEWLRPKKREVKPRDPAKALSTAEKAAQRRAEKAAWQASQEASNATGASTESREVSASASASEMTNGAPKLELEKTKSVYNKTHSSKTKPARAPSSAKKKNTKGVPTPSASDDEPEEDEEMPDLTDAEESAAPVKAAAKARQAIKAAKKTMGRSTGRRKQAINYAEDDDE